jgi:uncharacterized protein involved in type VI secretion and phage assembly
MTTNTISLETSESPKDNETSLEMAVLTMDQGWIGREVFRIQSFRGTEGISKIFEFSVELKVDQYTASGPPKNVNTLFGDNLDLLDSQTLELDLASLLGLQVSISLTSKKQPSLNMLGGGALDSDKTVSYFNGIISGIDYLQRGTYTFSIKPSVSVLELQSRYELYKNMTIRAVIEKVLYDNFILYDSSGLEANPATGFPGIANYRKQDWLQAGESDWAFISRLMEKAGIFYYFVHSEDTHTIILCDKPYYYEIPNIRNMASSSDRNQYDNIKSLYLDYTESSLGREDVISKFDYKINLVSKSIATLLAEKKPLWVSDNNAVVSSLKSLDEASGCTEVYQVPYGAKQAELEYRNKLANDRLNSTKVSFSGTSSCHQFKAGYVFLVNKPSAPSEGGLRSNGLDERSAQLRNTIPALVNKRYLLMSVEHNASVLGGYTNEFSAIEADKIALPYQPKSDGATPILALVCAAPGVPVTTGSSARYLAKADFDYGINYFSCEESGSAVTYKNTGVNVKFITDSSTDPIRWVRLADNMATIPEIGVYVLIGRSADDAEVPEVQQVYDGSGNRNIRPSHFSKSTSWGNSYSTSYGNNVRINFGYSEGSVLPAACAIVSDVEANLGFDEISYARSSDYSYRVTPKTVSISSKGSFSEEQLLDYRIEDKYRSYVDVSRSLTVGDSYNNSISIGDSESVNEVDGDVINTTTYRKTVTNMSTNYGNQESIAVNKGTTTNDTTNKKDVLNKTVNEGAVTNITTTNTENNETTTNISNSKSTVGVSNSNAVTGLSNSANTTGMSNSVNTTGISSTANFALVTNSTTVEGMNNSVSLALYNNSVRLSLTENSLTLVGFGTTFTDTFEQATLGTKGQEAVIESAIVAIGVLRVFI